MPVNPHFSTHFAFNSKGQAVVVEQDSAQDLEARAYNVAVCSQGFREDLPEYGIPNLLFQNIPLNLAGVQADIAKWANLDVSITEHQQGLESAVRVLETTVSP